MGIVKAVCISDVRGIQKHNVGRATLRPGWGIEGDAHAGNWHRQVSLLSADKVEAFYRSCRPKHIPKDEFARNGYIAFWNERHRRYTEAAD